MGKGPAPSKAIAILFLLAMTIVMPMARGTAAEGPDLRPTGKRDFEQDGVQFITRHVGEYCTFAVRYSDQEKDPPKTGYPRLLIDYDRDGEFNDRDDLNLTMDHMSMTYDYGLGADFGRNYIFDEPGTYRYAFFVINEANETAFLGPFEGPVILPKEGPEPVEQDWRVEAVLWMLLLVVVAVSFYVVGLGVGQARKDRDKRGARDRKGSAVKKDRRYKSR